MPARVILSDAKIGDKIDMTASTDIRLELSPPVATIRIDCPDALNRLNPRSLLELGEIVETLRKSDDIHAIVVTGTGDDWFSAGLMNAEIRAGMTKNEVLDYVVDANRIFDAFEALPQITIAAINGKLMAGASEFALACDIRIAGEHSTLMLPEARWGGFPGAGGPHRLPMAVGHAHALELIATGKEINAREMERIGFIQHVHPKGTVLDAAMETARAIGANGPLATRGAKTIARARREPGFRAARELSDTLRYSLEWSHDVDEGLAAAQEGRPPNFTGK
jgi:enoyl-CoA hydratase/carnithine racemase